ncbi:hypothetical protein [Streptomyces luteireticuli]|uniref:SIS domain-containing protein n=1 Tax=Streptomyces luteireticuli TaxID=173858 RepID=A0ABP3IZI8_9ACTN
MDAVEVTLLREVLAGTEWLRETRRFAGALRRSAVTHGGGLLLVGTDAYEPWHLAAHLDEEAARCGLPELRPTLVRHRVPPGAPDRLAAGLDRLSAAAREGTLLVVAPQGGPPPGDGLLERVADVRRGGATVLALEGAGTGPRLAPLAHEVLSLPSAAEPDLDAVQHLISAAAGEDTPRGHRFLDRLSRLAEQLLAPPPHRW